MTEDHGMQAGCVAVDADLAELALGTLAGRQRAVVLAHLEGCTRCSGEVEQLTDVADALLQVAPGAEPPVGFEVRLFDRLGVREPRRFRFAGLRNARVLLATAAVVVALALAFGGGWMAGPNAPAQHTAAAPSTEGQFAAANLVSGGQARGHVSTYAGNPAWMFMIIRDAGVTGTVTCQLILANGSVIRVGSFWLEHGYGAWSSPLSVGAGNVRGARVLGPSGQVLAGATFSA
jgi:hypothetical protein